MTHRKQSASGQVVFTIMIDGPTWFAELLPELDEEELTKLT